MTRDEFVNLLMKATAASIGFARQFVDNQLPDQARYLVLLNQSYDGHATSAERTYPEDAGRELACLGVDEVAELLLRDERCPAWIDILVEAQSRTETHLCLYCCGRFVNDPQLMYYTRFDMGSFGVKSPFLPFSFERGVARFSLPIVPPCRSDGDRVRAD